MWKKKCPKVMQRCWCWHQEPAQRKSSSFSNIQRLPSSENETCARWHFMLTTKYGVMTIKYIGTCCHLTYLKFSLTINNVNDQMFQSWVANDKQYFVVLRWSYKQNFFLGRQSSLKIPVQVFSSSLQLLRIGYIDTKGSWLKHVYSNMYSLGAHLANRTCIDWLLR